MKEPKDPASYTAGMMMLLAVIIFVGLVLKAISE